MARTGRPKTENPRTVARHVRYSETEDAKLRDLAARAGLPIGEYIRKRSLGERVPKP
jgi:hypothetical protein